VTAPRKPELTASQAIRVGRAREAVAMDTGDIAAGQDPTMAAGYALGVMRAHVGFLLEVIGELTGGAACESTSTNRPT
jgi:hypothetical protein